MSEYEVKDYNAFDSADSSTKNYGNNVSSIQDAVNKAKTVLSDTSIFEGPIQESCVSTLQSLDADFQSLSETFNAISGLINQTDQTYQTGDQGAANAIDDATKDTNKITQTNVSSAPSGVLSYTVGNLPEAGSQVSTLGKKATLLDVQVDGHSLGQDGSIVIKKGQQVHLKVKIPDEIQNVQTLKRTSADGASGWSQYVSQQNTPNVNKNDSSTYVNAREYDWYITGNTDVDNVTLSQTALFSIPGAQLGSYKGMVRVRVKIVD